MMQSHRVDLAGVQDLIDDMTAFDAAIEDRIAALDEQIACLQAVWVGEAAAAQKQAHAELLAGLAHMRSGLQHLKGVARVAHANYSAAAASNVRMFGQVG